MTPTRDRAFRRRLTRDVEPSGAHSFLTLADRSTAALIDSQEAPVKFASNRLESPRIAQVPAPNELASVKSGPENVTNVAQRRKNFISTGLRAENAAVSLSRVTTCECSSSRISRRFPALAVHLISAFARRLLHAEGRSL